MHLELVHNKWRMCGSCTWAKVKHEAWRSRSCQHRLLPYL